MESGLLEAVGKIAGIGGIALGVVLLVFRDLIRKLIFTPLDRERAYRLLRQITLLAWSVAVIGIVAWAWVETRTAPAPDTRGSTQADRGGVAIGGNVSGSTITTNHNSGGPITASPLEDE